MLQLKNNIQVLIGSTSSFPRLVSLRKPIARSFTSSLITKKNYGNNNQSPSGACQEKDDMDSDSQDPFVTKTPRLTSGHRLSFMPVVNIPQTEFAHNTFFSLHRPLLGLADNMETSFFSNQNIEEENVDEQIANYMINLRPFEPPTPPGTDQNKYDSIMVSNDNGESTEMEENYYLEQLPMYYMPESDDLVEYLSTLQEQLIRQSAYDHTTTACTLGRTKRQNVSTPSSLSSTILSKYQKWNRQGLYRHRWNK